MGYTGKVKKTLKEYFEYNSFLWARRRHSKHFGR